MMPFTHNSLYVLVAVSVLVLDTNALQLVNSSADELVWPESPKAFIRRADKETSEARVMVFGSGTADIKPRYHHIAKTGITSLLGLLLAGLGPTQNYSANMGAFIKQPNDFYIGSIRNPCNYYVSLWSYNVEKETGQVRKELSTEEGGDHYFNVSTENKTSEHDIKLFREFVKDIQGDIGVYTGRIAYGYIPGVLGSVFNTRAYSHEKCMTALSKLEDFNESQIDCWVSTEKLSEDTTMCMKMLEKDHGWPVNWTRFNETLMDLETNPSKHAKCKDYFDESTEKFIHEKDELIFDKFKFDECCDASTNLAAHLKRPLK